MPPIARAGPISPVLASNLPVAPETRFFGATESPISVTLDASGQRGAFSADVPLDSFKPPLSLETLKGLSVRVSMPPNQEVAAPVTVVQRSGRSFLHVELPSAEVNALRGSPILLALGEARSLTGTVVSPKLMLQVNVRDLQVDQTQPVLVLARKQKVVNEQQVAALEADRAQMLDGSSTWFGGRQLQDERVTLAAAVAANTAALAPLISPAESALDSATDMAAVFSLPPALSADREQLLATVIAHANLDAKIKTLQTTRAELAELPSEQAAIDAELIPLEQQQAAQTPVHPQVQALYAKVRAEDPTVADSWLRSFASMVNAPNAATLTSLLSDKRGLEARVATNDADLARLNANIKNNSPLRIDQLTAQLATARQQLAQTEAEIAGLSSGSTKSVAAFTSTYSPEQRFI